MSSSLLYVFCVWLHISQCNSSFEHRTECPIKFPSKVPPLKDLHTICSNLQEFKLRGNCVAENCSMCIPPNSETMLDENKEAKAWQDAYEQSRSQRRDELQAVLAKNNIDASQFDPIILMVINRGYLYLFYNFLCSLDFNGIDGVRQRLLVIVTDKQTQLDIQQNAPGVMTLYPQWLGDALLTRITPKMAASFALGAHRWVVSLQIAYLNDLMQMDYNVVLQDSDVIWKRNAFSYLQQPHLHHLDVQMTVDGRYDHRGPGNSGFLFIKHSCKTKVFVETLVELIPLVLVGRSDQILWNMLLQEQVFRQIHFETLCTDFFVCGYQINLERGVASGQLPETTIIVHASWTTDQFDKIEKFYMSDTWYFTQQRCPDLYQYQLLPDLKERKWHIRDKTQAQETKFKGLGIFRDSTNGKYDRTD